MAQNSVLSPAYLTGLLDSVLENLGMPEDGHTFLQIHRCADRLFYNAVLPMKDFALVSQAACTLRQRMGEMDNPAGVTHRTVNHKEPVKESALFQIIFRPLQQEEKAIFIEHGLCNEDANYALVFQGPNIRDNDRHSTLLGQDWAVGILKSKLSRLSEYIKSSPAVVREASVVAM